jgi:hypothetical protein
MIVKHEDALDLYNVLETAIRINNIDEVTCIINEVNANSKKTPLERMKIIKYRVEELDPHNPEDVVRYILKNVHPDVSDPVQVILKSSFKVERGRRWLQCFRATGK